MYLYFTDNIENIYSSDFLSKESVLNAIKREHEETWTNGIHDICLKGDERKLVFIHGTNAVSNCWCDVMTEFNKIGYTVISVDLPAFGISDCDESLKDKNACEVLQYYDEILYDYFVKRDIVNSILIGHSFGGFIASYVASKHPDLFSHLILVNSAGILPTLGANGIYWAIFFKLGLLSRQMRFCKGILTRLLYPFVENGIYLRVLGNESAFGDRIVSKFITLNYTNAYWNRPLIQNIINTPIKIGTIFGANDSIMPVHIGLTIQSITDIPCFILPNMDHHFCHDNNFVSGLLNCMEHLDEKELHDIKNVNIPNKIESFVGTSYLYHYSMNVIKDLYNRLHEGDVIAKVIGDGECKDCVIKKCDIVDMSIKRKFE